MSKETYIAGVTESSQNSFPVTNGPRVFYSFISDAFVAKIIRLPNWHNPQVTNSPSLGTPRVGGFFTYSLKVTNLGPEPAFGVTLATAIGSKVVLAGSSSAGNCFGNPTVTCNLGTLNPGSSTTVQITVKPLVPGFNISSSSVTWNQRSLSIPIQPITQRKDTFRS